ncbi:hypothetical protein R5W23_005322 [Gemmata sp. JC673]|uniref:DoxX family protein n=1 Tax=Gemmata algarum TaxID=2975278 RepID=A0ABU5F7Y0_9BACT|nr:hypothetical protein [Gemmata algarum]MDY3563706.1 hypothetical protein [Gemmata algarum]
MSSGFRSVAARYGYGTTATLAGLIFFTAALLKYQHFRSGNAIASEQVLFVAELLLGTWLLLGLARTTTRYVGIGVFALLFAAAAYKYRLGASSCGCFGAVTVPPWVTMIVDGLFVVAFCVLRPQSPDPMPTTARRARWAFVLLPIVGVLAIIPAVRWRGPATPTPPAALAALKAEATSRPDTQCVAFRATVVSENADIKESKTVTERGPNGIVSTYTIFAKQELSYEYVICGDDLRRDRTVGGKTEEIVVRHKGVTLQYAPGRNQAFIRKIVDYEDLPVDPRCFGLRRGADNLATYIDRLRTEEKAEGDGERVTLRGRDGLDGTVELRLVRAYGYRPEEIVYRLDSGAVHLLARLEYAQDPNGGWYLRTGRQYFFGTQQPRALDSGVDAERAWVAKITYTCETPRPVSDNERAIAFVVTLPAETKVVDVSTGMGVSYRVPERAQQLPFEELDPLPGRRNETSGMSGLRVAPLGFAALATAGLMFAVTAVNVLFRRYT